MVTCPYCDDDKKPRGLKNHVRMAGGEHGDAGTVPDDFDDRLEADDAENDGENPADDAENGGDAEVTTVTPDELQAVHDADSDESDGSDDGGENGDDLPFDPDDPDAIRLDGGETLDIRTGDGEIMPGVKADDGDYLLKTDKGPVLYDADDGEMYEVVTV